MSTWLDLSGAFSEASPKQIAELNSCLKDTGIEVADTGYFSFSDSCSYSRYDEMLEICTEFGLKHRLSGYMDSKHDGEDEAHHFFGTIDQQQRLKYWHLKVLLDEAQKNFDAHVEACEEKNIARWILERGIV